MQSWPPRKQRSLATQLLLWARNSSSAWWASPSSCPFVCTQLCFVCRVGVCPLPRSALCSRALLQCTCGSCVACLCCSAEQRRVLQLGVAEHLAARLRRRCAPLWAEKRAECAVVKACGSASDTPLCAQLKWRLPLPETCKLLKRRVFVEPRPCSDWFAAYVSGQRCGSSGSGCLSAHGVYWAAAFDVEVCSGGGPFNSPNWHCCCSLRSTAC